MIARGEPFRWPITVYYEDTDAAGVVYYANYLRYLERARTEWLGALGFSHERLLAEHRAVFVVHRVEIDFRAPARLGDRLSTGVVLAERGRAKLVVDQTIERGTTNIASARVTLAAIDPAAWRPLRIPATLVARLSSPTEIVA